MPPFFMPIFLASAFFVDLSKTVRFFDRKPRRSKDFRKKAHTSNNRTNQGQSFSVSLFCPFHRFSSF
jgi:hypothetical protein